MTKHLPFRTRYSHVSADVDPGLSCPDTPEDRRTKSEFADECDINLIMARFRKTGVLPQSAHAAAARYGDFSQVPDFMQMQDKLIAANELFAALPAAVRKQFDNDPGQFVAAADTKEGRALMVKLGLVPTGDTEASTPPSSPSPSSTAKVDSSSSGAPLGDSKGSVLTDSVKK